jgi:hypothetical protein
VNSLRNLTQLVEGCVDLAAGPLELHGRAALPGKLLLEQAQLQRQRNQSVLRTVVEIALQSLPLSLAGLDNSRARPA